MVLKKRNNHIILNFEPYQYVTIGILCIILATTVVYHCVTLTPHPHEWVLVAITLGYIALSFWDNQRSASSFRLVAQAILTVSVFFSLYYLLAMLPFDIIPYDGDPFLARLDSWLAFGAKPSLAAERFVSESILNLFSFFYALFIPYLYFSIFISMLGRPDEEKKVFITAFAFTYAISFLGYLFVPAKGPVVFYQDQFVAPLQGGYFHQLILESIDKCGGPHGAFPSLHVGASWFVCYFDLKFNRLRGLIYFPLVVGIACATILLRYHYLIDVFAGVAIAFVAVNLSCRIHNLFHQRSHAGFKVLVWRLILSTFYKEIKTIANRDIPRNQPIIFVANHVNALVDPFVISAALKRPMLFTAKAALVNNPYLKFIASWLNVILFQRPQDDSLTAARQFNNAAFQQCVEVLSQNQSLCIFPEGKSHSDLKMRPFKTGVARIAAQYLEEHGNNPPLLIVPVGLNYTKKEKFRSEITVSVGEPITLDPERITGATPSIKEMTLQLEEQVRDITFNFKHSRESLLIPWVAELYLQDGMPPAPLGQQEKRDRDIISIVNKLYKIYRTHPDATQVAAMEKVVAGLRRRMVSLGLNVKELYLPISSAKATFSCFRELELVFLGLPLWLLGVLAHVLPLSLLIGVVKAITKDRDHWATHYLFLGTPLMLFYYLSLGMSALFLDWKYLLAPLAALPFSGYVALHYSDRFKLTLQRIRTFLLYLRRSSLHKSLKKEAEFVLDNIRTVERRPG